jgi:hypothetical protein
MKKNDNIRAKLKALSLFGGLGKFAKDNDKLQI